MFSKYRRTMLGLICVAPLALAPSVGAQAKEPAAIIPELVPALVGEVTAKTFVLRHVPPDLVAWWIDPAGQTEPSLSVNQRRTLRYYGLADEEMPQPLGAFVKGVLQNGELLVADNARNRLLFIGAGEERVREIARLVAFFDRPLRQVEIEMQLVEVDDYAMKRLGIKLFDAGDLKIAIADARGKRRLLQEMVTAKHARIVKVPPRITFLNNVAGVVDFTPSPESSIKSAPLKLPLEDDLRLPLEMRLYGAVTPTINNDDTVTMILRFAKTRWINRPQKGAENVASASDAPWERGDESSAIRYDTVSDLRSVINVRDGDTLMLSGLNTKLANKPANDTAGPNNAKTLLLLVTPRIIRRIDEADAKDLPAKP